MKHSLYEELERVLDKFSKYQINILLDSSAKVGKKDISRPTIGNESLHEINNNNNNNNNNSEVRVVYFATSKYFTVRSKIIIVILKTLLGHILMKRYIQIDHILIDREYGIQVYFMSDRLR
jgi:hypothetical protein